MSFSLNDAQLDDRFEQIPVLAGLPRQLEELSGGLTNRNVKVTTPDGVYVARCCDTTSNLLGIDREQEHFNTRAAEQAGVGAPVIDFRPDMGILLLGYLEGKTLANADFQRPGVVAKAARSIRTLHQGPRFQGDFDMFARQAAYLATVKDRGYALPPGYDDHADAWHDVRRALAAAPRPTVPCNNDLLAGNFIEDGDKIWLIDYEYSGNNDPCFELGNTATECGFEPEQVQAYVEAYFGTPTPADRARVRLQMLCSEYGWSLWGFIQAAASSIDFDFLAWGQERFDKAARTFTSPELDRLLEEVVRDD